VGFTECLLFLFNSITELVICKWTWVYKTPLWENWREMLAKTLFILCLIKFLPRIIYKFSDVSIQLQLTNIFCMQSYKIKLFLDLYFLQVLYIHNTEGTLHDSCSFVSYFTARVTHLNQCGFQWFLYCESAQFIQ
jgi:hypothetical protein